MPIRPAVSFPEAMAIARVQKELAPDELILRIRDVRDGEPLSSDLAVALLSCEGDVQQELLQAAVAWKQEHHGAIVSYSRKVFLPLTNLCRDYCGYCTFRRDPGEPGAHTMPPEEVLAIAKQGEKVRCTEALFSLGDKPEML